VLSFAFPRAGHAVLHFWDEAWNPVGWYVNVEAPLRRTAKGLDTFDHDLDVLIEPDRSAWRWKDEDDVALGIEVGAYTPADAEAFRREGERGLRRVLDREPPFDREWAGWRPDPAWGVPELPEGWDRVDPG
jgi:predicted RNA-binding protein associated with RNAse of E/G family